MATSCVTLEKCTEMLNDTQLQVTYFETCNGFVRYVAMQCENCWSGKLHFEPMLGRFSQPTGASLASSNHAPKKAKFAAASLSLRQ